MAFLLLHLHKYERADVGLLSSASPVGAFDHLWDFELIQGDEESSLSDEPDQPGPRLWTHRGGSRHV